MICLVVLVSQAPKVLLLRRFSADRGDDSILAAGGNGIYVSSLANLLTLTSRLCGLSLKTILAREVCLCVLPVRIGKR